MSRHSLSLPQTAIVQFSLQCKGYLAVAHLKFCLVNAHKVLGRTSWRKFAICVCCWAQIHIRHPCAMIAAGTAILSSSIADVLHLRWSSNLYPTAQRTQQKEAVMLASYTHNVHASITALAGFCETRGAQGGREGQNAHPQPCYWVSCIPIHTAAR